MVAGPRFDHYRWSGGREAVLRFGPDGGPVAVVAMPLLEEANRTRAVVTAMLRALAERGVAGVLPDLPGQGDSPVPTDMMTLATLAEAFAAVVDAEGGRAHIVAIRSGALLDRAVAARARWLLTPQDGGDLLRELARTGRHGTGGDQPRDLRHHQADDPPVAIAGNLIAQSFLDELAAADPGDLPGTPRRIVRFATDPRPADRHLAGAPPWRRSEPANDPDLARLLADDLADWIAHCGG